jgi:copper chaperone CopZ
MDHLTLTLPALYGDHHVASVRSALVRLDGVSETRISPAVHAVTISFDPARQSRSSIEAALATAGYLPGDPERALPTAGPSAPRHTAVIAGTFAFMHEAPAREGRPLWPCPGFDTPPIPED